MRAIGMKTVFIGSVAQADGIAVGIGVAESSLHVDSFIVFGDLEELTALLLRPDAIFGLVTVTV